MNTIKKNTGLSLLVSSELKLILNSPSSTPGNNPTPIITIAGIAVGHTVKLYTDSQCTTEVASGTAQNTSIDLISPALSPGVYTFYAKAFDASGNSSSCSVNGVVYELDPNLALPPSGLTLQNPTSSPGTVSTPTITASGIMTGDVVSLYTDSSCTNGNLVASGTASGTTINLTSSVLSAATYTFYAKVVNTAGNVSSCSTASVTYQLLNTLGAFAISGITGNAPDTTADNVLGTGSLPTVVWGSSAGASSYDVTVYANDGTTTVCATQNTASTSYTFTAGNCGGGGLTSGSSYKVSVIAKATNAVDQSASNSLYTFQVNRTPAIASIGPWYVLSSGSITVNLTTTAPHLNASDADGDPISVSGVGTPTFGSMSNTASSITFTPGVNTGVATVNVDVDDSRTGRTSATITFHVVTAFTWSGGGANANFATSANWCGAVNASFTGCANTGVVPSSSITPSHIALFDGTCSSNCSPTIAANAVMYGMRMNSGFTGTITQGAFTMTVGTGGWTMAAGTFNGSSADITFGGGGGGLNVSGGIFNSTSGNLTITQNLTVISPGAFNHSNGHVIFYTPGGTPSTVNIGTTPLNNVTFNKLGVGGLMIATGTVNIDGNLSITSAGASSCIQSGTFAVKGNVSLGGSSSCPSQAGILSLVGTNPQTLTGTAGANGPSIVFDSPGGVTVSGQLDLTGNWTWVSGALTTTSSLVNFVGTSGSNITAVSTSFDDVTFNKTNIHATITGTMNVAGDLTMSGTGASACVRTGTIAVSGNVIANGTNPCVTLNSATISFVGTNPQTLTGTAGSYLPTIDINSSGGVTLLGQIDVSGSWVWTSGSMTAGASLVNFVGSDMKTVNTNALVFNDVTVSKTSALTTTGTLYVDGNLELSTTSYMSSGTIEVTGNVNATGTNSSASNSTVVSLVGTNPQTLTSVSTFQFGAISINSPGGVTLSGTIDVQRNWTHLSGSVTPGASTVIFSGVNGATVSATSMNFFNLKTNKSGGSSVSITGSLNVTGDLEINNSGGTFGYISGGGILVAGNVTMLSNNPGGSSGITFSGGGTQSISATSGTWPGGTITVNKSGGSLSLASNVSFSVAGQDMVITAGTVNMGVYTLTVADDFTVGASGILNTSANNLYCIDLFNSGTINPGAGTNCN